MKTARRVTHHTNHSAGKGYVAIKRHELFRDAVDNTFCA